MHYSDTTTAWQFLGTSKRRQRGSAFLAPSIVTAILEGRQPADLSLKQLMYRTDLAVRWPAQRRQLGFEV
jgi:hypothetical protein